MFSFMTENIIFLGKGHEVYVDPYFLRKPVCSLVQAKLSHTNVSGTIRRDSKNLPEKAVREDIRSQVANLPKGGQGFSFGKNQGPNWKP